MKGLAIQGRSVNPSEAALRALYEKRQGGIGGFDGYVDVLRGRDRAVREEKILGERIAQLVAEPAFALNTLDGRRLALPDFKGKIVVINFWGIWCGPCVREMPDVQKLHTQDVSDPDVLVLTIDNDRNPDDVAPWMKERTFTFPVLLDDGYVSKAGIHAFPMTWFLDRDGERCSRNADGAKSSSRSSAGVSRPSAAAVWRSEILRFVIPTRPDLVLRLPAARQLPDVPSRCAI